MTGSARSILTWIDVARILSGQPFDRPESVPGLSRTIVTWDVLTVEVDAASDEREVGKWLEQLFPSRIGYDPLRIQLDGPLHSNCLPVFIEEVEASRRYRPSLGLVDGIVEFGEPIKRVHASRPVPIAATLSVKGGTGRTTTAVALALKWAAMAGKSVMLVDADLEAPGISYLIKEVIGEPHISLEDTVALAHSDESPGAEDTIDFVANRLKDQKVTGEVFILPLRRDIDEISVVTIRPEHLSTPVNEFALADLLSNIARKLDCAGVVIDVRAGLVPMGVNLAIDPAVSPIFITTLASQSLRATCSLIRYIARENKRSGYSVNRPLVIVNRVPNIYRQSGMSDRLIEPLVAAITASFVPDEVQILPSDVGVFDESEELDPFEIVEVPELPDLQVSSAGWHGFAEQMKLSGFASSLDTKLAAWISSEFLSERAPLGHDASSVPAAVADVGSIATSRTKLADFAGQLISAENTPGRVPKPLVTAPLAALAQRFQAEVPIAISEGAKGTGKTLAARFLTDQATWDVVVNELIGQPGATPALIIPVCGSIQVSETFQAQIDTARNALAEQLGFKDPMNVADTTAYLRSRVGDETKEAEWVNIWLDVAAWSVGFDSGQPGAGTRFIDLIRELSVYVVILIEGLEELYKSAADMGVNTAMYSALVSLPQKLRSEPKRPVGLIAFVRRDTVEAAVRQNIDQFRREYASFALTWTDSDVLELAAWLATKAEALPDLWTAQFSALSAKEKASRLRPLWGLKLGPDDKPGKRTKEAYTATWIIAVLSDLRGRLVPRDLVRLMLNAAKLSTEVDEQAEYSNRVLVPRAIKMAVEPTSMTKVKETEEEINELQHIFDKFRARSEKFAAPVSEEDLDSMGISRPDLDVLRRHGIVFGETAPYEVPELFRRGLGLRHAGARRSVVNLYRKARERLS